MEIGNIDMFLESITIVSAFNNALQKRFLKPNTISLILTGDYSGNLNYSKKALMLLVYREVTDGCLLMYGRDVREYRLPKLPNIIEIGFCAETRTLYEFLGCFGTVIRACPSTTSLR